MKVRVIGNSREEEHARSWWHLALLSSLSELLWPSGWDVETTKGRWGGESGWRSHAGNSERNQRMAILPLFEMHEDAVIRYVTDSHWHRRPLHLWFCSSWSVIFLSDVVFCEDTKCQKAWLFWTGAKVYWLHILCHLIVEACLYFTESNIQQQEGLLLEHQFLLLAGGFQWRGRSGQYLSSTVFLPKFWSRREEWHKKELVAHVKSTVALELGGSSFHPGYTINNMCDSEQSLFPGSGRLQFFLHPTHINCRRTIIKH